MQPCFPALAVGLAVGIVCALAAAGAAADGGKEIPLSACSPVVEQKLTALAVNRADIDTIQMSPRYSNQDDETNRMLGLDAWVRLKSCPGSLIIDMFRDCSVRQVYMSGRCTLPGVK